MNSHYTGYELELNQSRQATIRAEFEYQARTKSLNEDASSEASFHSQRQSEGLSKTRIAGLISLVVVIVVLALAYFFLGYTNQVTALSNNVAPTAPVSSGSNNSAVVKQDKATSVATSNLAQTHSDAPLVGIYLVRVMAKDIPALLRFEEPSVNKYLGEWAVSLDDQGIFTASLNDQIMLQGQLEVTSDQITFTSWQGNGNALCSSDPEEITGTYRWEPGEDGINLIIVSDKCYARSLVLSTHSLKVAAPIQNPTTQA